MKFSILIPVYNYDCRKLVTQLREQLTDCGEIVVADDCSTNPLVSKTMEEIDGWSGCRTWTADTNMGRAAIRNRLADMARGEWLMFIDCDAEVRSDDFVERYLHETERYDVVCGGTGNMEQCPSDDATLRYKYERHAEKRLTLERRQQAPYSQFTTFNFMIRRDTFRNIRFDENCKAYGHEDTLFGLELRRMGVEVHHIDNKLTHLGLEDAVTYLHKTETALHSLACMNDEIRRQTRMGALHHTLSSLGLVPAIRLWHKIFNGCERRNLLGKNPNIYVFALYKTGYFCSLNAK